MVYTEFRRKVKWWVGNADAYLIHPSQVPRYNYFKSYACREGSMRLVTVLVVDDDPDILEALSEILEAEGFKIKKARNGLEALDRLAPEPPDLILLDLMMPVMDGWEFAKRMKQDSKPGSIPIIVLSADRNVNSKAKEIGAVGYLAKPFELNELLTMVRSSCVVSEATRL